MILMESLSGSGHTRVSFRPKPIAAASGTGTGTGVVGGELGGGGATVSGKKEMLAWDPLVRQVCLYREVRKIRTMNRLSFLW